MAKERKLVTYKELRIRFGINYCRTHLKRRYSDKGPYANTFPKPVEVGSGRIAWYEDVLLDWIANLAPSKATATD